MPPVRGFTGLKWSNLKVHCSYVARFQSYTDPKWQGFEHSLDRSIVSSIVTILLRIGLWCLAAMIIVMIIVQLFKGQFFNKINKYSSFSCRSKIVACLGHRGYMEYTSILQGLVSCTRHQNSDHSGECHDRTMNNGTSRTVRIRTYEIQKPTKPNKSSCIWGLCTTARAGV